MPRRPSPRAARQRSPQRDRAQHLRHRDWTDRHPPGGRRVRMRVRQPTKSQARTVRDRRRSRPVQTQATIRNPGSWPGARPVAKQPAKPEWTRKPASWPSLWSVSACPRARKPPIARMRPAQQSRSRPATGRSAKLRRKQRAGHRRRRGCNGQPLQVRAGKTETRKRQARRRQENGRRRRTASEQGGGPNRRSAPPNGGRAARDHAAWKERP